jgi:hypothetical protein
VGEALTAALADPLAVGIGDGAGAAEAFAGISAAMAEFAGIEAGAALLMGTLLFCIGTEASDAAGAGISDTTGSAFITAIGALVAGDATAAAFWKPSLGE